MDESRLRSHVLQVLATFGKPESTPVSVEDKNRITEEDDSGPFAA
jgi:hypothetical protein